MDPPLKKECGICGESRQIAQHNLLKVKTKFSSTTVVQLLERFSERDLSDRTSDLEQLGTCKGCYTKLNDYDAAYTKALIIQQELTDLLQHSSLRLFDEIQIQSDEEEEDKGDEKQIVIKWDEQSDEIEQSGDTKLGDETLSVGGIRLCMECDVCGVTFSNVSDVQQHTHDEDSDDGKPMEKDEPHGTPILIIESIGTEHLPIEVLPEECDETSNSMYTDQETESVQACGDMKIKLEKEYGEETGEEQPKSQRLECLYCDDTFEHKQSLREHFLANHPIHEVKHVCKVCGQSTKTRAALASHYGKHARESELNCSVCNKKFAQKSSLDRHMAIHTGIKAYQCDQCGKQYIHYSSFYMHKLAHKGVRAKQCTICGYSLPSNSKLNRHMRTHSGEKPFSCPVCGQKFSQRYNMVQHLNTHGGKSTRSTKTYSCSHCDHVCDRSAQLKKHLEKYHPDKR